MKIDSNRSDSKTILNADNAKGLYPHDTHGYVLFRSEGKYKDYNDLYYTLIKLRPNTQYKISITLQRVGQFFDFFTDIHRENTALYNPSSAANGISLNNPRTFTTDSTGLIYCAIRQSYLDDFISGVEYFKYEEVN